MLADATRTAVVGTVRGMVDANELLSARPRGPLNLGRLRRRRRVLVGGAVALAALLLDELGNEHICYLLPGLYNPDLASTYISARGYHKE